MGEEIHVFFLSLSFHSVKHLCFNIYIYLWLLKKKKSVAIQGSTNID